MRKSQLAFLSFIFVLSACGHKSNGVVHSQSKAADIKQTLVSEDQIVNEVSSLIKQQTALMAEGVVSAREDSIIETKSQTLDSGIGAMVAEQSFACKEILTAIGSADALNNREDLDFSNNLKLTELSNEFSRIRNKLETSCLQLADFLRVSGASSSKRSFFTLKEQNAKFHEALDESEVSLKKLKESLSSKEELKIARELNNDLANNRALLLLTLQTLQENTIAIGESENAKEKEAEAILAKLVYSCSDVHKVNGIINGTFGSTDLKSLDQKDLMAIGQLFRTSNKLVLKCDAVSNLLFKTASRADDKTILELKNTLKELQELARFSANAL